MRRLGILILFLGPLALAGYLALRLTPWPSALMIRHSFDRDAIAANDRLAALVPAGLRETPDIAYLPGEPAARLSVILPAAGDGPFPVVVWVHGGAWISGSKDYIANYLRLIAAKGFAVVGIDYAIAPGATYPTPVVQTNAALAFLSRNAAGLKLDMSRFALAGDSAGAQIAAQTAITLTDPAYAARTGLVPGADGAHLKGLVLFCGGFDARNLSFEGAFGSFLRTVFWSYFGARDFAADPRLADFSIPPNLHSGLPPIFISAGNADPLEPQSRAVAERAEELGIRTDALFFPKDHVPPLGHEYQFTLDEAGGEALARSLAFLDRVLPR